jgi:hypothetical protein
VRANHSRPRVAAPPIVRTIRRHRSLATAYVAACGHTSSRLRPYARSDDAPSTLVGHCHPHAYGTVYCRPLSVHESAAPPLGSSAASPLPTLVIGSVALNDDGFGAAPAEKPVLHALPVPDATHAPVESVSDSNPTGAAGPTHSGDPPAWYQLSARGVA